jgi:uncharacterized repeat protein (TIGR01451 family)
VLLASLAHAAPAAADRAMSARFSTNDTGNIAFAANTLMVCPAAAAGCTAARTASPVSSGSDASINNNSYTMEYVNTAPGQVGGSPSFDSSSAQLALPPTATVLFAGLYWGGDTSKGTSGVAAPSPALLDRVGFRVPGSGSYATVVGAVDRSSGTTTRYGAFADVTSAVQAAGAGAYAVANVQAGTGQDRYGGWTLVVAYHDSNEPPRNLTVDDGFVTIGSSSKDTTIPISGFRTPPSGAVRTTLGFVAYEGDAGSSGDFAALNGTRLSGGATSPGNFFDSGISNLGLNVTTRTPSDPNNLGFDAKLVNANGLLPNNATSASIVVGTSGDAYFPAVVTLATDLYAPVITSRKSVADITRPGGPVARGDVLRYSISYTNSGADAATNMVMRDPIPGGSSYVPGSLRITAGPQAPASLTDAAGDDAGEVASGEVVMRLGAGGNRTTGGTIGPGVTVTATFDTTVDQSDAAGQQIVNQAAATFIGQTLGLPFSDTSPQVVSTVTAPDLTIDKSHSGSLVGGVATTFTLAVSNIGNGATDGSPVTVTDSFPPGAFGAIANAGGAGWACSIAGLSLSCSRSDPLAGGASYPPILVDATVANPTPPTISNTATVAGGGDSDASNNSGSDGGGATGLADVSIAKSADASSVPSGGVVTYTLDVANAGPSTAQDVTVADALDPGSYADVSVQTTQGTCDATVSCSLGALDPGSTATVTITATIIARNTTLANTAHVSTSTPDPDHSNDVASVDVTVPGTADLSLTKAASPAVPDQGGPDTFTLTVANNGPDDASGVVVNDPLPGQFTAASATGGGFTCTLPQGPGGNVVCTRATLPVAAGPQTITITGTIAAGTAAQRLANAAVVSSLSVDPDQSNNADATSQLIAPAADVAITKRALESDDATPLTGPVPPGGTFDYQLTVTNAGPSPASAVQLTDTLATGLTLLAAVPGCSPGAGSGGTITCTVATLAAGGSQTFDLNVQVSASAASSAPTNTATVSSSTPDSDLSNQSASATVGIGDVANLSVAKTADPQVASVGDVVTYTLAVTNDVPAAEGGAPPSGLGTTGAVVTDPLPADLVFVSSPSGTCVPDSPTPPQTVTCRVGPVAEGDVVPATFTARVLEPAAGTIVTNRATVASVAAGGFPALPDLEPSDNSDAASVSVAPQADLSLTKSVSDPNPGTDRTVGYTLTVRNAGPNDATGVMIDDVLPAGLDFVDASTGCVNDAGVVSCDVGTVPSGGQASVTIRVRTTGPVAGSAVTNLASVSGDEEDPAPGNDQASVSMSVQPLVDLELTKTASNPSPSAGGPVSYVLSLHNNGPSPATGVTISDPLPAGLSFASGAGCGAAGQLVTCDVGTVAAGGTAAVTLTVEVADTAGGTTITNVASATANEPIARPPVEARTSITPVPAGVLPVTSADLSLTKRVDHPRSRMGQILIYTIVVTNHGPSPAVAPVVTDVFSRPATLVRARTPGGTCTIARPVTCRLPSLPSGVSAAITVAARPRGVGVLRNTAAVRSTTPDPDGANNLAHATTTVGPAPAGLSLVVTPSRRRVRPGQEYAVTFTVRSLGPAAARGVLVCGFVDARATLLAARGAMLLHGRPCWRVPALAVGKAFRAVVHLRAPRLGGRHLLAAAATASAVGVRRRTAHALVLEAGRAGAPPTVTG